MQIWSFVWLVALSMMVFGKSVRSQVTFDGANLFAEGYEANYSGNLPEAVCSTTPDYDDRMFDSRNIEDESPTYLDPKTGLIGLGSSTRRLTAAVYDGIVRGPGHTYLAGRKGCVGLLSRDGKVLIPFTNNSLAISDFSETENSHAKSTVFEAVRPDGRYLFKIDLVGDRIVASEGPFVSVANVRTPIYSEGVQRYAAVSDKYNGRIGILDQDLNYVLPVKYERVRRLEFADGRKYWIGVTDRVQNPSNDSNQRIDTLWSVQFVDNQGAPIRAMRVYALKDLKKSGPRYGFVGLQEDKTCVYIDGSLNIFEIVKSFDNRCATGDRHHRIFITRPDSRESVIWTLGPAQETSSSTLPAWKQDRLNMEAFEKGAFVWRKTYEGDFSQAGLNYNYDFVLLKSANGKAFKIIDRFGRDTGETYDSGEVFCNQIYVRKGNRTFRTRDCDTAKSGPVMPADNEQRGYCLSL
ncbi:hypothetical protein [Burkholderia ubonensis]|uniref:hypothetical protein n=1 Tax=Burkholderia ubonensis TaxID=101571 RepID=UPI0011601C27|nr:hypothetical protein [Burkholderia ubonensis]